MEAAPEGQSVRGGRAQSHRQEESRDLGTEIQRQIHLWIYRLNNSNIQSFTLSEHLKKYRRKGNASTILAVGTKLRPIVKGLKELTVEDALEANLHLLSFEP